MSMFFGVVALVLWVLAVTGLGFWSMSLFVPMFGSARPVRGALVAVAAIVLFALPFGLFDGKDDPRLCLRGHQEYQRQTTPMLVGKVIVPTTTTHKVWVCDQWEAR